MWSIRNDCIYISCPHTHCLQYLILLETVSLTNFFLFLDGEIDTTVIVFLCCCTPFWNSWLILVFTLLRAQLAWLHSQRLGIKYPFYQLGWKRNFGGCLQILPACVELGVMNGVSDVPPICVHPAQRGSIITLFLAGRTQSQFVPDIILQAEHTLFHHILLWPIMGLLCES